MNYNILGKLSLIAFIPLMSLTACDNDETALIQDNEKADGIHKYIIPEESNDTTIAFIGSDRDLQQALAPIAERHENYLLQHGWVKENTDESATRSILRARSVRTDTVYVTNYSVDDYSDPSVYANFNAKFSRSMVDSINRVVSSDYRISTSKTYVCEWRLFPLPIILELMNRLHQDLHRYALLLLQQNQGIQRGDTVYTQLKPQMAKTG